jgi:hypothetical protein
VTLQDPLGPWHEGLAFGRWTAECALIRQGKDSVHTHTELRLDFLVPVKGWGWGKSGKGDGKGELRESKCVVFARVPHLSLPPAFYSCCWKTRKVGVPGGPLFSVRYGTEVGGRALDPKTNFPEMGLARKRWGQWHLVEYLAVINFILGWCF